MWVLSDQGDVPVRGEYTQAGMSLSHEGGKGAGYGSFWSLFAAMVWQMLVIVTRSLKPLS